MPTDTTSDALKSATARVEALISVGMRTLTSPETFPLVPGKLAEYVVRMGDRILDDLHAIAGEPRDVLRCGNPFEMVTLSGDLNLIPCGRCPLCQDDDDLDLAEP